MPFPSAGACATVADMSAPVPKTVRDVVNAATEYLARRSVFEPRAAVEWLLARLLRCKRLDLSLHAEEPLGEPHLAAMRRGVARLANHEPLQYILGDAEFMGRRFKVDRRALIPRPETELLVEAALACPVWRLARGDAGASGGGARVMVVDVGAGSGCIAISLALARSEAVCVGFDVSGDALALAKENALALDVADRVAFASGDLAECLDPQCADLVVSNPPYVATADYERLPPHIREYEPRLALDGGPSGLDVVASVTQDAAILLKPGGSLFLEIGAGQGSRVRALLVEAGFTDVAVRPDLAGHDRMASGRLPEA
jgi:release factor glutamine methyltransferase